MKIKADTILARVARLLHSVYIPTSCFGRHGTLWRGTGGTSSRFALKEQLLLSIGAWTNTNSRTQLDDLLQFIREHMMPESRRDLISRESILARFGVSDKKSIFPCPPDIKLIADPVLRSQVQEVLDLIQSTGRKATKSATAFAKIVSVLRLGGLHHRYDLAA